MPMRLTNDRRRGEYNHRTHRAIAGLSLSLSLRASRCTRCSPRLRGYASPTTPSRRFSSAHLASPSPTVPPQTTSAWRIEAREKFQMRGERREARGERRESRVERREASGELGHQPPATGHRPATSAQLADAAALHLLHLSAGLNQLLRA